MDLDVIYRELICEIELANQVYKFKKNYAE